MLIGMLIGYAQGGPRNGVKLSAGIDWDGRIPMPREGVGAQKFYPGHYEWVFKDPERPIGIWEWIKNRK